MKDVIQLFFLEIWEKEVFAKNIENPKAYLIRSFYRKMFQQLKKQHRMTAISIGEAEELDQLSFEAFVREQDSLEELQQTLKRAIGQLPEKEREIFRMKYLEGLAYEDIALHTGKSKQTVYNQIHNSVRKLRAVLSGYALHLKKNIFFSPPIVNP